MELQRSVSLRKRRENISTQDLYNDVEYPKSAMPTIEDESYVFVEEDEILEYTSFEGEEKELKEEEKSLKLWLRSKVDFEEDDLFEALESGIVLSKLISDHFSFKNLLKIRTELVSKMLDSKFNFRILNEVLWSKWNFEIKFEDVVNRNKIPVINALERLKIEIEKEEKKEAEILQEHKQIDQHEKSKFRIIIEMFILPYLIFYFIFERIKKIFSS